MAAVTTIVTVEEQWRGWLARIAKINDPHRQIEAYAEPGERVNFLASFTLLPWDKEAGIASPACANKASASAAWTSRSPASPLNTTPRYDSNTVDFAKVPSLRFENWLD